MYSSVHTAIIYGIDSLLVETEADISDGLPMFELVGYLSSEVREARDRVRTALKNCGFPMPVKRITVSLSPANVRKSGSGFDVPIAVALLAAMGHVPKNVLREWVIIGELSLEGKVLGIPGVLPMVWKAKEAGMKGVIVPMENGEEAGLVPGMDVFPAEHLREITDFLAQGIRPKRNSRGKKDQKVLVGKRLTYDFSDINGQSLLKRACEVAVSGMHNLLMIGPPGAGKTMAARAIPSILPPMTEEEQMELSKIYSVCGKFGERDCMQHQRPFRCPHHTISTSGLMGGGRVPVPGEISLAHGGVLFLDELTEFRKNVIESLRQPLEDRRIQIVRNRGVFDYPADFMLVAAMNPCECGYFPDREKCRCSAASVNRYISKLSQPMLDRMDVCIETPDVGYRDLTEGEKGEGSEEIRKRVVHAQQIQAERFEGTEIRFNSRIPANRIKMYCELGQKEQKYMEQMYARLSLTARSYHRLLRVARTIADMEGKTGIRISHLQEAVCYRGLNRKFWENCV